MSLRSIPLRLKLVAALVLPMLVVAGYLAVNIRTSMSERAAAQTQQEDVDRFVAVAGFSDAIGVENLVISDRNSTDADLSAARAETDAVMQLLRSPDLTLDPADLAAVESRYSELLELRAVIGDRPLEIRLTAQSELRSGELTMTGEMIPALTWLSSLPSSVLADLDLDASVGGTATAELLDDYFLVQRYRADLSREVSTLLRVSSLPSNLVDADVTELVGTSIGATDQSRQLLVDLGSAQLIEAIEPVLSGSVITEYDAQRQVVDATTVGVQPAVDLEQLQASASRLDVALDGVGNQTINELDTRSSDVVFEATRDLVLSILVGFWLLVLVGLLLRVLYRAIKSPIERLTEQAQQISLVELPEIVSQMRRGEIDSIPQIEEINAETNDEIGDLVHAFNGMHRTAVELAAEQANSRRVVADMFVNLGRRNQRLVNRLLKGLTVLEQHEEDPDKLASLYEIDHVATRMRRNAESLLVLAGAGQSRHWDRPVPLYDITRASLAEVENYERVQIDVGESHRIDGGVVADLTHLLAELVENALSFSPPTSPVEVVARATNRGLLVAVSDHGVGMSPERLLEANRQITQAAGEDETPSEFLGHYVVGRLAARHGIEVELLEGPAGGVTARVLLPSAAVAAAPEDPSSPTSQASQTNTSPSTDLDPFADLEFAGQASTSDSPTVPVAAASAIASESPAPVSETRPPVSSTPYASIAEQPARTSGRQEPSPVAATLSEQAPRRRTPQADSAPEIAEEAERIVSSSPASEAAPLLPAVSSVDSASAGTAPNPASFEWPSPAEVDPLTQERPTPSAPFGNSAPAETIPPLTAPSSAPSLPGSTSAPTRPEGTARESVPAPSGASIDQLGRAADDAVNEALSVFGTARRTPGAQMPTTDLFASIAGSMRLGSSDDSPTSGAATTSTTAASVSHHALHERGSVAADLGDEEQVRFDLSGFQQGTNRADRELGDNDQ